VFGTRQACELRLHLTVLLSNVGAEVISGDMVIEVRPYGVHKGTVVERLVAEAPEGSVCLAMGDDRTDEDMFTALPADAISVHVGPRRSRARLRLRTAAEARAFLRALVRRSGEPGMPMRSGRSGARGSRGERS
jgi:trehalose 6-phosphate synthase/phosphatase